MIDAAARSRPRASARSARAARWRPPSRKKNLKPSRKPKPKPEPAPSRSADPPPAARKPAAACPRGGRTDAAAPEPERAPAQVIPFPAPAPRPQRGAALLPGLAAHARRLHRAAGRDLRGQEGDRSVRRRRDREGPADRRHRRPHQPEAARRDSQLAVAPRAGRSRRGLGVPAPARHRDAVAARAAPRLRVRAARSSCSIIGVNGSGKTTTIGKLAARLAGDGKKVLLAAGDTFRAAAVEQLDVWAKRTLDDARARQGERRPVVGHLRRRQARRDRSVRRRDLRHRRPPAHEDGSDAGAAEGPPRGRQGAARARRTRPGW